MSQVSGSTSNTSGRPRLGDGGGDEDGDGVGDGDGDGDEDAGGHGCFFRRDDEGGGAGGFFRRDEDEDAPPVAVRFRLGGIDEWRL